MSSLELGSIYVWLAKSFFSRSTFKLIEVRFASKDGGILTDGFDKTVASIK